jgi:dGTPase
LTWEVRDGILNHSGGNSPATLEGQVVHFSDRIAYINHDIEDAQRAGILTESDLPSDYVEVLGFSKRSRINGMILNIIQHSTNQETIAMSPDHWEAMNQLRRFMFETVYMGPSALKEEQKTAFILRSLFDHYMEHPDQITKELGHHAQTQVDPQRRVADFIAGMTDRYAMNLFGRLFIPNPWRVY